MSSQSEIVPTREIPDEMPVPSRDIFPSDDLLNLYPEIAPILRVEKTIKYFKDADAKAIIKKSIFVRLGTISLILVALVLTLLSWRLSLALLSISFPFWLELSSGVIGLIALFIQLYLFLTDAHQNWLYSRYIAEKTRLWRFQILLDGEFVSKFLQSPASYQAELEKRWIVFKEQFNHGLGGMNEFIEYQPLELMIKPTSYTESKFLAQIKEIYLMLRIDVQSTHFGDQYARLSVVDSLTDSWAKVLLGTSGILAVFEACLLTFQAAGTFDSENFGFKILTAVMAGLSLTFAIVSAAIRVYRSASAIAEDRERYRSKQNHLKRIKDFFKEETDSSKILDLMTETEHACNEELQEFLISLRRSDYFF